MAFYVLLVREKGFTDEKLHFSIRSSSVVGKKVASQLNAWSNLRSEM